MSSSKNFFKFGSSGIQSELRRALLTLPKASRKKFYFVCLLQISLGFLDLLGVLCIGFLSAVAVSGLQGIKPGSKVYKVLELAHISQSGFKFQIEILGGCIVVLLVGKTILSILFSRRALFFLSRKGAELSSSTLAKLLGQPLLFFQKYSSQELIFSVTQGIEFISVNILGIFTLIIADLALLVILAAGLFVVDIFTALSTIIFFLIIGTTLHIFSIKKASVIGVVSTERKIQANEKMSEVLATYRESVVRNRRDFYARRVGKIRMEVANGSAELNFLPYVSKYVLETSLVIGTLSIGTLQFFTSSPSHAISTLAIFLGAGTRIAPALLRVQQGLTQIKSAAAQAIPSFRLIESLSNVLEVETTNDDLDLEHDNFYGGISLEGVTFSYPGVSNLTIQNVSLEIEPGDAVAIVGLSGAGKSTLVDLILGVLSPDQGNVRISGVSPLEVVQRWPGSVAYVPQDVVIVNDTIRENVALGYPEASYTKAQIAEALKFANLSDFVSALPEGMETIVGESGSKLSGGQRQRLGIARAMFTKPHVVVFDESTSALDSEAERLITQAINQMRGEVTIIMIAHRLSTVRDFKKIAYLSQGRILKVGSFQEVRSAIPDFDEQAKLMGL